MGATRFIVTGKVQGVWFRAGTREQALALGLRGHALNRPDGSVEVVAAGDDAALARLDEWLHQGPPLAKVEAVRAGPADESCVGAGFTTR